MEEMPAYSKTVPAVNQVEYHPHFRRDDIKEYCKKHGIYFQAFSSLGRQEPALINDPVVVELAKKHNTSVEQILLSFATSQGIGIVPKSTTPARIASNFQVLELKLDDEELKRLNSIDKNGHYIRCTGWLV
ncbi:Aldo keto reductase domain containing protein [Aphelenchoides fujianensis]|nr:Aldo keto reductase domain containing protein [Aphelenchoides fujianensis]